MANTSMLAKVEDIINNLDKVKQYYNGRVNYELDVKITDSNSTYLSENEVKVNFEYENENKDQLELFKTLIIDGLKDYIGYHNIHWSYSADNNALYYTSMEDIPMHINKIKGTLEISGAI